jgi:hypothetical protein
MDTFLERLQQQLAQYGLNPLEWQLVPVNSRKVRVLGDGTEFVGDVCGETLQWLNLRLVRL